MPHCLDQAQTLQNRAYEARNFKLLPYGYARSGSYKLGNDQGIHFYELGRDEYYVKNSIERLQKKKSKFN